MLAARASPSVPIHVGRSALRHPAQPRCLGQQQHGLFRQEGDCMPRSPASNKTGREMLPCGESLPPVGSAWAWGHFTWCCAARLGDSGRPRASWLWLRSRHAELSSVLRQQLFQMGKHLCTSPACRGVTWQRWAACRSSWPRLQRSPHRSSCSSASWASPTGPAAWPLGLPGSCGCRGSSLCCIP